MGDEHLIERTIEQRIVHRGTYLTFRVDTIEDAAGRRHTREVAAHPGAVCIVALVDGEVLMVRQFRHPVGEVVAELPAGTLDRDEDGATEEPARAAARELGEETGYRARRWRELGRFWTAPGFTDERMHLYLATALEPIEGYAGPEQDERLDLLRLPWQEAVARAESGDIGDAKSLVGLLRLARLVDAGDLDPAALEG